MTNYNTKQKLRGGYYTPSKITQFLCDWSIRDKSVRILEPSFGNGCFLVSAAERLNLLGVKNTDVIDNLYGIEYYKTEAQKAIDRLNSIGIHVKPGNILTGDFFRFCKQYLVSGIKFDVIIGNPPFIRYQNFPEEQKSIALLLMAEIGIKPNRLTNSWVPFLVCSSLLLSEDGILAMVIPGELFQVNYAAKTRQFLANHFKRIGIISFKNLVFDTVQQDVVLLLAEKNGESIEGINVIELNDIDGLDSFNLSSLKYAKLKPIDHNVDKWTKYFLTKDEILFLNKLSNLPELKKSGEVIDVDIGIVTGQNKYFVLSEKEVTQFGLSTYVKEIVTRSNHLKGLFFTKDDWQSNSKRQFPTHLFYPPIDLAKESDANLDNYINKGKAEKVNQGFKCRTRKYWYIVPSTWVPDFFMLRQVHLFPKLVVNKSQATSTDTIHRAKIKNGFERDFIAGAFLNSLTFAFSEITGRSYGGGVLTFEPSEAEYLPLPLNEYLNLDLNTLDKSLREGKIEEILEHNDIILLKEGLGLDSSEIRMLKNIWVKLRNRRINRKKSINRKL